MYSSFHGRGLESLVATALSLQYSTQDGKVSPRLGRNTIGEAHFVCAGVINFIANIISIFSFQLFALSYRRGMLQYELVWLPARIARLYGGRIDLYKITIS